MELKWPTPMVEQPERQGVSLNSFVRFIEKITRQTLHQSTTVISNRSFYNILITFLCVDQKLEICVIHFSNVKQSALVKEIRKDRYLYLKNEYPNLKKFTNQLLTFDWHIEKL